MNATPAESNVSLPTATANINSTTLSEPEPQPEPPLYSTVKPEDQTHVSLGATDKSALVTETDTIFSKIDAETAVDVVTSNTSFTREFSKSKRSEDEIDGIVEDGQSSSSSSRSVSVSGRRGDDRSHSHHTDHSDHVDADIDMDHANAVEPSSPGSSIHAQATGTASTLPARVPTPSSRTSTPPLPGATTSGATKKKFSSVSVNTKFLKAVSPAPAPAKPRPAAAPVPIQSSSSKLLSIKLTSVPSSKPSTSPKPVSSTGTSSATSSPWAKPAVPLASESPLATPLQHPAPTRGRGLTPAVMAGISGSGGSGHMSAGQQQLRRAWGTVGSDGRRVGIGGPPSLRDFPTAKEVAEGQKAALASAQAAAQAEAAHNQAILQGLNAFTHLEPNAHRWDDEDDDDDIIDFGDGRTYGHDDHPGAASDTAHEEPVAQSERFADDFDRSWPRRSASPNRMRDEGRVLFNASLNRLEPTSLRQPPPPPSSQPQQPRLMAREREPSHMAPHLSAQPHAPISVDRSLPPHLSDSGSSARMLPPHMTPSSERGAPHSERTSSQFPHGHPPHALERSHAAPAPPFLSTGPASTRMSWRTTDREPPSNTLEQRDHVAPHAAPVHARPDPPNSRPTPTHPSRQLPTHSPVTSPLEQPTSLSPAVAPARLQATITKPAPASGGAEPAAVVSDDAQAAEMHSAAEKARLRRMAEESEREAAAERARRKARELAERFGDKSGSVKSDASASPVLAPRQDPLPLLPPPSHTRPPPPVSIAARPPREAAPTLSDARLPQPLPQPPHGAVPQPAGEASMPPADRAASWRRAGPPPGPPGPATDSRGKRSFEATSDGSTMARDPRDRDIRRGSSRDAPPVSREYGREHDREQPQPQSRQSGLPGRDLPLHLHPTSTPMAAGKAIDTALGSSSSSTTIAADFDAIVDALSAPVPGKVIDLPKKEASFDAMLARLQAAMAQARASPTASAIEDSKAEGEAEQVSTSSQVRTPAPGPSHVNTPAPTLAPPLFPHLPADFFDVTQVAPPRSPPPAWRQYTVRIPKEGISKNLGAIPRWRLKAAETSRLLEPKGWIMSFNPPLDQLSPSSLSRAELLLPQLIGRRFTKQVDTRPIVSISPRTLVRFQKQQVKRRLTLERVDDVVANVPPPHIVTAPEPSQTEPLLLGPELGSLHLSKPRQPTRPSDAHKADKDRLFMSDGSDGSVVLGNSLTTVLPTSRDAKPAVRFMVSSELEGDSLLDEVNKMSLETVGEAEVAKAGESPTGGGGTRARTPPIGTGVRNPPSPAAAQTAWAKSPLGYTVSQSPARGNAHTLVQHDHDHIKSVWEQTAAESATVPAPTASTSSTTGAPATSAPATVPSQPETPLYPTLNSPVTVAPEPTTHHKQHPVYVFPPSGGMGSQPGSSSSPFGISRAGYYVNASAASPDGVGVGGLQYGIGGNPLQRSTSGFQQGGLWTSPFGSAMSSPGYGYGGKGNLGGGASGMDDKTMQQAFAQGPPSKEAMPYGSSGDYRYQQHQQIQHQHQQQHPQQQPPANYQSYNGYQYGRNQNVYGHVGGFGSHTGHSGHTGGFGTQMSARASGGTSGGSGVGGSGVVGTNRFQANGIDYQGMGYDSAAAAQSGYYTTQHPYTSAGGSGVSVGVGTAGAVGQQQGGGGTRPAVGGRKMW